MSLLEKIPTLPFAGTLDGTEALGVIGSSGLPVQTTTQAVANLGSGIPSTVSEALWTVDIATGVESGNAFPFTVQVLDLDGNNLSGARDLYVVTLSNNTITYTDNGAGAIVKQGFTPQRAVVFQTDSTGLAEFTVGNSATEAVAVVFVTPQGPVVQLLSFA